MPVFKNESNGTWYVMARYVNWKGERKQKCKRGFATKKEAQEWERMFQLQNSSDMDMSFEAFTELYIRDMKSRLKGISAIWTCGLWRLWGNDDQTGCSGRRKGRCLCLLDSYGAGFSAVQAAVEAAKGKTGHS